MTFAVETRHLDKTYRLFAGPLGLLRESLLGGTYHQRIRALQDVSLSVPAGEAFGLVGRNGAGKSTLLKVLAGTTFPTRGEVLVRGRASALLELGAGFHPEFTGRENIRFSGALAGADAAEVQDREEEIVRFSELGEFIDRPVKTYSSGMFVRLGFSVATGFDPDILIIDEALAVGDEAFQKKCTDRIVKFRKDGGTILFCSHNLHQVKTLCSEALWLKAGRVESAGRAAEVLADYRDFLRTQATDGDQSLTASSVCRLERVEVQNEAGEAEQVFGSGETLRLEVTAHFSEGFQGTPGVGVVLLRNDGVEIFTAVSTGEGASMTPLDQPGIYRICLTYPKLRLLPGSYHFNVAITDGDFLQAYSIQERAASFRVRGGEEAGSGLIHLDHTWSA